MNPDQIDYHIQTDGTCSYCGRQVEMYELPDGKLGWADKCHACEEYNKAELIEALAYEVFWGEDEDSAVTVNISGLDFEV